MAVLEDEAPRLAEVVRIINDFRSEFREAMKNTVRREVYDANAQVFQLHIANLQAHVAGLEKRLDDEEKERRTTRNLVLGLAIPTAVTLFVTVLDWVIR